MLRRYGWKAQRFMDIVMWAAAIGAFVTGFRHMPWPLIIAFAALWVLGYFLAKPGAVRMLQRDPIRYPFGLLAANCIGSGLCFGAGWLVSLAFH